MSSIPPVNPAAMAFNNNNNSLITPPNPLIDSFSKARSDMTDSNAASDGIAPKGATLKLGPALMSPPISPSLECVAPCVDSTDPEVEPSPAQLVQDPVLFPAHEAFAAPSPEQTSLFTHADTGNSAPRVIEPSTPSAKTPQPVLTFKFKFMDEYLKDPKQWFRDAYAAAQEADRFRRLARLGESQDLRVGSLKAKMPASSKHCLPKRSNPAPPRDTRPIPSQSPPKPAATCKADGRPTRNRRPTAAAAAAAAASAAATALAELAEASATLPRLAAPGQEPVKKRATNPRTEDKDVKNFDAIPDYCPDPKSLDSQPKRLEVDWKGSSIDLTNDPLRGMLHADELTMASSLRLDCAHYLTVKRRFFVGRLNCLKEGKQFRKTDAQKACRIDVNKASQMWMAFERVGWLKEQWMAKFL